MRPEDRVSGVKVQLALQVGDLLAHLLELLAERRDAFGGALLLFLGQVADEGLRKGVGDLGRADAVGTAAVDLERADTGIRDRVDLGGQLLRVAVVAELLGGLDRDLAAGHEQCEVLHRPCRPGVLEQGCLGGVGGGRSG